MRTIVVDYASTFGDVTTELATNRQRRWTVLEANYGPWPYWRRANLDSAIGAICQTIYAIDEETITRYVLGVVRNSEADIPLIIVSLRHQLSLRASIFL